jgi:neutral ceramidase
VVPGALPGRAEGVALKKALLALVVLLVVAFCSVPLPARHASTKLPPGVHGEGALLAGAAQVRIKLGDHPVLAGYAGSRRAREVRSPVYARALALEAGGSRAYIASIDTLLIPPGLSIPGCGFLAATHTHSGPGGLWDSFAAGFAGAGRFDSEQFKAVQDALEQAIDEAGKGLAPATLLIAGEEWKQGPSRPRSEGPIDTGFLAFRLQGAQKPIATVIDFAMHPTSAPRDVLSADWPGVAASKFDEPLLVLQGAGGNATFDRALNTDQLGTRVAEKAQQLLVRPAASQASLAMDCAQRVVDLPAPQANRHVPWIFRRAFANLLALGFAPQAVETHLALGPITLMGIPGEPVGELGLRARPRVLVSLSNGYLGYVETEDRWNKGLGESGRTDFGPTLARALDLAP